MKNKKQKSNITPFIIIAVGVVLAIAILVGFFFFFSRESNGDPYIPDNNDNSHLNNNLGTDPPLRPDDNNQNGEPENNGEPSETLSLAITQAFVAPDQILNISSQINALLSTGTCYLTLTHPNGTTVTREVGITALPSVSTCMGFHLPANELASGTWTIHLRVSSGNQTGSTTSEVNIP